MNLERTIRRVRRLLTAQRAPESVASVWARQPEELTRAMTVVRAFYACAAFLMVHETQAWAQWARVEALHPLWPLAWAEHTGAEAAVQIVLGVGLSSTVACLLLPELRALRVAAAVGLLLQSALVNSLAGAVVMHGWHVWIWIAALFVFLPSGSAADIVKSRPRSQRYLRVFWAAQTTVLLFYSLGGSIKAMGAVWQGALGRVHAFAPEALARHTAFRILEGAEPSPYFAAGPWLIEHPSWGILVYPLAIYLETFAFVIAFRPALHRLWATGLIAMHLCIYFVMTVLFSTQMLMLAIMFLASPFIPARVSMRDVVFQLPLLGDLLVLLRQRNQRAQVQPGRAPPAAV